MKSQMDSLMSRWMAACETKDEKRLYLMEYRFQFVIVEVISLGHVIN